MDSRWPIYALAAAIGACCVGLLLHSHRVGRAVGVAGWLVIALAAGGVAALTLDGDAVRIVGTVAVGLPLVGGTILGVLVTRDVSRDLGNGVVREATRAVAMSSLTAVVAISGWWATTGPFADRFVDVPASVSRWFRFAALGAALSAMLAGAIGALLLAMREVDRGVRPLITRMPEAHRVHCTYSNLVEAPLGHDPGARILWRLTRLGQRLWRSAKRLYVQTVNGLLAVVAAVGRLTCRGVNWTHRRLVLIRRVVVFVIVRGLRLAVAGMSVGARAGGYSARPIGAYVAAIGGSVAALHLAQAFTEYLVDGPLRALAAGAAWSILGLAVCVVIVERLASVRSGLVVEAVGRFVSNAGPDVVLLVVLSGWVVGVPGSLGYGPIRIGWVTGVGTLALIALMAPAWAQGRRDRRSGLEATARPKEPAPAKTSAVR